MSCIIDKNGNKITFEQYQNNIKNDIANRSSNSNATMFTAELLRSGEVSKPIKPLYQYKYEEAKHTITSNGYSFTSNNEQEAQLYHQQAVREYGAEHVFPVKKLNGSYGVFYSVKVKLPSLEYFKNRYESISSKSVNIDHSTWIYNQMTDRNPSQMLNGVLNLATKKLNTKVVKIINPLLTKIGNRHGINVTFHSKANITNQNILGWYQNGNVNYVSDNITIDTYVHEFSHLWTRILKATNPNAYKSVLNKVSEYLQTDSVIAKLINNRLRNYDESLRQEEALAILAGITSIPALIKYTGNDISVDEINYNELSEFIGEDMKSLYDIVSSEMDISSLENIDYQNATLFEVLNGLTNDIINGKNLFDIHGTTLQGLRDIGALEGFMTNNVGVKNVVVKVADISKSLTDSINDSTQVANMTDTQLSAFIDKRMSYYVIQQKGKSYKWEMGPVSLDVIIIDGKLSSSSKKKVMDALRKMPEEMIGTWKEVYEKIITGHYKGKDFDPARALQDIIKTRFDNPKYNYETAKIIADIMGFDGAIKGIYTLKDLYTKYPHVFGKIDMNLFEGLNPMIVLHSDISNKNSDVYMSIFSLEKLYNHITSTSNRNMFSHLVPYNDNKLADMGLNMAQNSSNITNMQLGFLAAHLADNVSKLKIRNIGTLDMASSFKANIVSYETLYRNIAFMKQIPELYDVMPNSMKAIIDNASEGKYNEMGQDADGELKAFYYHSMFYAGPEMELKAKYNKAFSEMEELEKKDFIQKRMLSILMNNKNAEMNNVEFQKLSRALNAMDANEYHNLKDMNSNIDRGFRSDLRKFAEVTYNVQNPLVEWAIQKALIGERKSIDMFRNINNRFKDVALPVWNFRTGLLKEGKYLRDVGSLGFEHMFVQYTAEGKTYKLPFIWHNESLFFKHKMFKGKSKQQIINELGLTKEDLVLGDFVVAEIEKLLVEAEINDMRNTMFSRDEIKQINEKGEEMAWERIKNKGYKKGSGQVFAISKSANEMAFSLNIKGSINRVWQQTLDVNAIIDDQVLADKSDTFRNTMTKQLRLDMLLKQAGLKTVGDSIELTELDFESIDMSNDVIGNDNMSTNIEAIFNAASLSIVRQMMHSRDTYLSYKAAKAYMYHKSMVEASVDKAEMRRNISYLDQYYEAVIMNKTIPENFSFTIPVGQGHGKVINVGAGLDILGRGASTIFLSYSPSIALRSGFFNMMKLGMFGLSNLISGTDLPDITHLTKAFGLYTANRRRAAIWGTKYQIANASMYEVINSYAQNITKTHVLNDQLGHALNQYTDEAFRHITMIAFMLRDGSWDAHTIKTDDKGNEIPIYDETKDRQFYKDGKLTDKGKARKEAKKRDMVKQGLMKQDENILPMGYDLEDTIMMKAVADKWCTGSYTTDMGAHANLMISGKQIGKFRRFFWDVLANVNKDKNYSQILRQRKEYQDEDGNWVSKKEALENIGALQSFSKMFYVLTKIRRGNTKEMEEMTKMEWASITRSLTWFAMFALFYGLFGKFRDDDDKRKYYIDLFDVFAGTAFNTQLDEFVGTPLPAISSMWRLVNRGIDNPLSLFFYLPTGRFWNDVRKTYQFFEE